MTEPNGEMKAGAAARILQVTPHTIRVWIDTRILKGTITKRPTGTKKYRADRADVLRLARENGLEVPDGA